MKKLLLFLSIILLSANFANAKKLFVEMEFHKNCIKLDDGTNKKAQKVKDANGNDIKFISLIGALNYMSLQGWEDTKAVVSGGSYNGTGGTETKVYYIFCKEVPDDELQEAVNNSYKE